MSGTLSDLNANQADALKEVILQFNHVCSFNLQTSLAKLYTVIFHSCDQLSRMVMLWAL